MFQRFLSEEDGQGLVEYGLILVLMSIVAIGALQVVGVEFPRVLVEIGNILSAIPSL